MLLSYRKSQNQIIPLSSISIHYMPNSKTHVVVLSTMFFLYRIYEPDIINTLTFVYFLVHIGYVEFYYSKPIP